MELGKILEFRKDLYFEGAVQADWFYTSERSSKVAENFVFHGSQYFGIEDQVGDKKRINTISLVEELMTKLNDERSNALSLAIADYGTGKSHLAVTLAQIFSGPEYMPETYEKVLNNINMIDKDAAARVKKLSTGRNFVMVINGMRDFNLHSEILRAAQRSFKLYGLSDDGLRKLNRAIETAEIFFLRNSESAIVLFEEAAARRGRLIKGNSLIQEIRDTLMTDEVTFDIVNEVYSSINGQEIRWDEGLSASSILEMLISEYCGMNGIFDHIILLFDEFGRYLEYTAGVNAAKSGESGLQQIFELTQKTQNIEGYLHVINFIQRDIKAYLETVDQTKNVSRYIGRFDQSDKYYISSNLETVFANLIQRKDIQAFNNIIISWQSSKEEDWKNIFNQMNKWLVTKGMWKDYRMFRKVAVEGIYPMHPISTFMLTNLSDYLQNRSSLTWISKYIEDNSCVDVESYPVLIMPEQLIAGDLYVEMLSAEQEGRQKTQQCIKYDNVIRKYGDKLSDKSLTVLRSNLILRLLRFRTTDYDDAISALSMCSGLIVQEIKSELKWIEDEYAVLEFDDYAGVFDFTEESNGAHDFKIIKKRLMSNANVDKSVISSIKIKELAGMLEQQTTNFSEKYKITTNEWVFNQELYPIEEFSQAQANVYVNDWNMATGSTTAKGKLIWLYVNKYTSQESILNAHNLVKVFEGKPIIVMLLNDISNRLLDSLMEYTVLDNMDDVIRKKYDRHYQEDFSRAENNLKDEMDNLKKQRQKLEENSVVAISARIPVYLTSVFETIYPDAVPFFFDGFVTKGNNIGNKAGGFYCSFLKMLLSNSVSEVTIHNFVVEMRNRVESLFSTAASTSWKCINEQYKLIPPEEKRAKYVYESIVEKINKNQMLACKEIYETYCRPPFGMSEDVVTLMIAVVCANLSYCLRIRYQSLKNISIWKDDVVTNNDKKIDLKVIKESVIVYVDAGAVTGKYMRFFDKIKNNRSISQVSYLANQLQEMISVDQVPVELEQSYLLAQKTLDSGKKAKNEWSAAIGIVDEKFDELKESNDLYNAIVALETLRDIPYTRIFNDNGYNYDEDSKESVKRLTSDISSFIVRNVEAYIMAMYCKSVEGINTFRNHYTKIENKLKELGFPEYADLVRKKREIELGNIEEIRSRQELRSDYAKYMLESKVDKYTTYMNICSLLKEGNELQERVEKYKSSLGRDSAAITNTLSTRVDELNRVKERINKDMTDIWDDLYDVKSSDDVEDLLERINIILQKGISAADQKGFVELQGNLQELLADINSVKESTHSRKAFKEISTDMKEKYSYSEFDFEVLPIIEEVILEISKSLDEKEVNWKNSNLSLGDKSRASVHKWKEKTQYLPEYLSDETIVQVKLIAKEADEIISEGKIEDVLFYFNKLDIREKKECIDKLNKRITEDKKEL
ncbi:MAG: hypothetical protein QM644_07595 [Mobilitalea sp.]